MIVSTNTAKKASPMLAVALAALLISMLITTGCTDTRHTIRQVDQHPSGTFNTVETSGERVLQAFVFQRTEYIGINFWNCQQTQADLVCTRICDDQWFDGRICDPHLHHEFGTVSGPGAGVVMARYHTRMQNQEQPREVVEDDSLQRQRSEPESTPEPVPEETVEERSRRRLTVEETEVQDDEYEDDVAEEEIPKARAVEVVEEEHIDEEHVEEDPAADEPSTIRSVGELFGGDADEEEQDADDEVDR